MTGRIIKLYPLPGGEVSLHGVYLEHRVHALGRPGRPFVYGNFVSSLDGRIALHDPHKGESFVPASLTSDSDWRLFQELQAQADCLITHGGYLRALASGRLGNILQVGHQPESRDLVDWRRAEGFHGQPAVVVASASLDFVLPESLQAHSHDGGQRVYIATGKLASRDRIRCWEAQGYRVIVAGQGKSVEGEPLVRELNRLGYKSLYLIAGPRMLQAMLRDRCLSRLYMTLTHQVLAGEVFHTIAPGTELGQAGHLKLSSLYYDPSQPANTGQWFAQFEAMSSAER